MDACIELFRRESDRRILRALEEDLDNFSLKTLLRPTCIEAEESVRTYSITEMGDVAYFAMKRQAAGSMISWASRPPIKWYCGCSAALVLPSELGEGLGLLSLARPDTGVAAFCCWSFPTLGASLTATDAEAGAELKSTL